MFPRRASLARGAAVAVLVACAGAPVTPDAAVIQVPRQEATIASAMLRAAPGDTIVVEPGRYPGPIDLKPNVRLLGLRGPAQTTLFLDTPAPVLRSYGGGPATALIGFTLRGSGIGVEIGKGALQIYDCRFESGLAVGLLCSAGSTVRVFASTIEGLPLGIEARAGTDLLMMRNDLIGNAVGVRIATDAARVYRNEFLGNDVAIEVLEQGQAMIGGTLRDANGILGSRRVSLRNQGPRPVVATFNYWGTVDCDSVAARVEGPVTYLPMAAENRADSLGACP